MNFCKNLSLQQNFVTASSLKNSVCFDFLRHVAGTKFCRGEKDFHKILQNTRSHYCDMLLQYVTGLCTDLKPVQFLQSFCGHPDVIFLVGSDDRSVRLWDLTTGHCIYVLKTHTCADICFDDDKVITASFDNTVGMWDWKTGDVLQCFRGHTAAGNLEFKVHTLMILEACAAE